MPKRIQMSRQHPWRADNPDAVIVARPSKWGNPYIVRRVAADEWAVGVRLDDGREFFGGYEVTQVAAHQKVVGMYREMLADGGSDVAELAGHDLACWCPLAQPCHADVLLELANGAT